MLNIVRNDELNEGPWKLLETH